MPSRRATLLCLSAAALLLPGAAIARKARTAPEQANPALSAEAHAALQGALAHDRRRFDRKRDQYRHPAETLAFFRVEPGMTVIDFMPGGGWYTRILVPYLGPRGRYIAVHPEVTGLPAYRETVTGMDRNYRQIMDGMMPPGAAMDIIFSDALGARRGTVDRALIFREMHNLRGSGALHDELTAIHRALKPDGLLGIVQHRAKPDAPDGFGDGSRGYMREQDVIAMVERRGFRLIARSEINANPADPANHPAGVWELLPNLRTGREELRSIGESDRMTLLFARRK